MQALSKNRALLLALLLSPAFCLVAAQNPVAAPGRNADSEDVPTDTSGLYSLLLGVQADLNILLIEIGRDPPSDLGLSIGSANLRDVYYASVSMLRKTNRLSFELRRFQIREPERIRGEIRFKDIERNVLAADRLVRDTLAEYAISPTARVRKTRVSDVPYNDVLSALIDTNRLINRLLQRPFSPSDVFQEVTLAIGKAPGRVSPLCLA